MRHVAVVYGVIHAIIDATTVSVLFATQAIHDLTPQDGFALVLAYDLVAFGSQFLVGLMTDRFRAPRGVVLAGILYSALGAALVSVEPITAVVLVSVGNALFHVGASVFALSVEPGRATSAGLFVAPGALGLGFGLWFGKTAVFIQWPFQLALAASFAMAWILRGPELPYTKPDDGRASSVSLPGLVVGLLLVSVAVRSFVGMAGCYTCPRELLVMLGLPLCAFAGKAVGGFVADKLGWIVTGVGALLVSAPLIAFGAGHPIVVLAGLLFFQMTMPVTLVAVTVVHPRRPGFAFGLTCLALVLGSLPTFVEEVHDFYGPPLFLALILASTAALYAGLRRLPVGHLATDTRPGATARLESRPLP